MRHVLRGALAALAVVVTTAISFHTLSQAADVPVSPSPGDWTPADLQDVPVVRAAHFALLEQARRTQTAFKLLAIKHARQQVVAGMHYSMNLMVQSEGKRHLVIAVVWTRPDGSMELTRWHRV